jgi:hypothetical protein
MVDDMIGACWQGPPSASVEAVEVTPAAPHAGAGFTTRPTE